jgi:hypothetical protein
MDARPTDAPTAATRLAATEKTVEDLTNQLRIAGARTAQLENRLECDQRGLDARLLLLEGQTPSNTKPWYAQVSWDQVPPWLQAVATPLMVALVGWWLTGSLDLAIKQQQADVSGVKEMREALADLYASEPQKSKADTAALSIAAFGGVAAGPLAEAYNLGGAARTEAALRGLVAAAARDKIRVCDVVTSIAGSSTELYSKETRDMASDLQRKLRC